MMISTTRREVTGKVRSMFLVGCGGLTAFGVMGLWTGDDKFFENIAVPFLNRIDPEMSHKAAVWVAKYHLTRAAPEDNPPNLKTKIAGLVLSNPVGLAAGFDKSGECVSGLVRLGLGWVEIGSVTPLPQEGNPKPRLFRLPEDLAVINRYGFNNDGHDKVHQRIEEFKNINPSYPVGVNLGANKDSPDRINDYCRGVEAFSDTADYFVINISSPNTPNLRDLQKSDSLNELLTKVLQTRDKQVKRVPVFLKVAPDLTDEDIKSICKSAKAKGSRVDGLIVSNTTISRVSLKSTESLRSEAGGLSGKPLTKMSTQVIEKFYRELKGEIPIIGVGGIWDGKDAYEKICAGANAVQIYTALTYRGPGIIHKVKAELSSLLTQNGFESVEQAVGSSQTRKV